LGEYGNLSTTVITGFFSPMGCFVMIGLLSIYPTVFFIKNRKGKDDEVVSIPPTIFWMLRFELLLLFVIPLLAGLMAHGVGYVA
jgi:putative membrane protein